MVAQAEELVRFQTWFDADHGSAAAVATPLLSAVESGLPGLVAEIVRAGANYHNILSADRLDGLQRITEAPGNGRNAALEPLRRALQTRGGVKSQARSVGNLLFKEARQVFDRTEAGMSLEDQEGVAAEASSEDPAATAAAMSATEAAINAQADSLGRFQSWWDAGNGAIAAAAIPLLSVIDAGVLAEIIRSGANFHTTLNSDRLDGLQRHVDSQSSCAELDPLRRALQTRGGFKSQARCVGSLLFKEARAVFDRAEAGLPVIPAASSATTQRPPEALSSAPAAVAAAAPKQKEHQKVEKVRLDQVFNPPRLYVCSEAFPVGAEIAIRALPRKDSDMTGKLPHGTEFLATGVCGDYLEFLLGGKHDARVAYVPHTLGDAVVLVAARASVQNATGADSNSDQRIAALERKVVQQDKTIQALQEELMSLRSHMGAIASAFGGALAPPARSAA
eukprot:TRINITY_DN24229_c0_g1_i1.p1 TRINITY_DN24229_c0_g1~~TRINITY_DN24229_c0_g1_i1.p1  ORF type:complete len:486 (-),score=129.05 TRINITY_DN24229_c0_g1_i1:114-1463(-)